MFFLCPNPAASAANDARSGDSEPEQNVAKIQDAALPFDENLFGLGNVIEKARSLASRPYDDPSSQVPESLLRIKANQWRSIQFRPEFALWKDQGSLFEAHFFYPGFIFNRTITINAVEQGKIVAFPFSPDMFQHTSDLPNGTSAPTPLSFAGFNLVFPLNSADKKDEIVSFLGASYFRGLARDARYGISARGLAVNTSLPEGEEFPYFKEFWLVRPKPDRLTITLYALMDSPSLTGAYRFTIRPGETTTMDVEAQLFMRNETPHPQKIGLAPLTSMFLYSETDNGRENDYRPEVHDSDGLLYKDDNTWYWNPLSNPNRLGVNAFPLTNPRGFGLMQRDNTFDHYQDISGRFDLRPSLWVEPLGDWGNGYIELIEIPSKEEIHSNITAFWVPAKPTQSSGAPNTPSDVEARYPSELNFAYRLYWMPSGLTPHSLGKAVATRLLKSSKGDAVRFLIDFESEDLNELPADTGLTSVIELPENCTLASKNLIKNPVTQGWRLDFSVKLPRQDGMVQSLVTIREGMAPLRFRALLKRGENLPDPLTETWVYDLTF